MDQRASDALEGLLESLRLLRRDATESRGALPRARFGRDVESLHLSFEQVRDLVKT